MPGSLEIRRSSVSTTGYADGLGRRTICFDREIGAALECLALRPEFTPYEHALRVQADAIAALDDERLARVRTITHEGTRLAVTSELIAGDRLSDIIEARGAGDAADSGLDAAFGFLLQILPALSRLHAAGLVHGAVAPGRVVLTGHAQVVLADAIYGGVLPRLNLARRRLWTELQIAAPRSAGLVRFDAAADVTQASLCGLMLALGRAIDGDDPIDVLAALVGEVVEVAQIRGGESLAESVRRFFTTTLPVAGMRAGVSADQAARDAAAIANGELGEDACLSALGEFIRYEAPAPPVPQPRPVPVLKPALRFEAPAPPVVEEPVVEAPAVEAATVAEPVVVVEPDFEPAFEPAPVIESPPPALESFAAAEPTYATPEPTYPAPELTYVAPEPTYEVPEPIRFVAPEPRPVAPPPPPPAPEPLIPRAEAEILYEPPAPVAPSPLVRSQPIVDPMEAYVPPQPVFAPPPPSPRATLVAPMIPVAPAVPVAPAAPVVRLKQERPAGYTPPRPEPVGPMGFDHSFGGYPTSRAETGGFPKKLAAAVVIIAVGAVIGGKIFMQWESAPPADTRKPAAAASAPATKQTVANPAPAPTTGVLSITSIPSGARVLLNGTAAGETPLRLDGLPPGRHTLTLSTDSTTVKRTIRVEAGKELVLDIPVFSGWVAIYAPIVLDVAEGDRGLGSTEQGRILMAPGRHVLTVSNRRLGYSATHTVEIGAGEEARLNLTPTGTVSLNAQPWAEVWVDGTKVGETPVANLEVPLGTREFIFRHPQFGERRMTTTVTTTPAALSVDFTKQQ